MTPLDNPWLADVDRYLDAMFHDTTIWDVHDNWELFAYADERGLIAEIFESELTADDPDDPMEAFEAMSDEEAASIIEHWIERRHMISDFIDWRKENL